MKTLSPGSCRIATAAIAFVATVMTYPWHLDVERWVFAIVAALLVFLFGQWRGLYLTTILRRRLRLLLRGGAKGGMHQAVDQSGGDVLATMTLQIIGGRGYLPLDLIAGYLDRFGIRVQAVRVTSCDVAAGRSTWIGLTMSAAANLLALQARSSNVPLLGVAEATLRRLADELREEGWTLTTSEADAPKMLGSEVKEHWRAVADGRRGFVAAYGISESHLAETLDELWTGRFGDTCTAVEITKTGVSAMCAIRTETMPAAVPPRVGLYSQRGVQREVLARLDPASTKSLGVKEFPMECLEAIRWPASGTGSRYESQKIRQGG